jgi:hypothetical protein
MCLKEHQQKTTTEPARKENERSSRRSSQRTNMNQPQKREGQHLAHVTAASFTFT